MPGVALEKIARRADHDYRDQVDCSLLNGSAVCERKAEAACAPAFFVSTRM
jgi:hypothetical protein